MNSEQFLVFARENNFNLLNIESCLPAAVTRGGAHGSGTGIGNVDTQGNVHPDQFWQSLTLGNVKQRPFSEIWRDASNETLAALRNRAGRLEGQCAGCRFLDVCGGGFRVRAVQVHGNLWAPDPACYLSEEETALTEATA